MRKDETCWDCKHLLSKFGLAPPVFCKAFPDKGGIPFAVASGNVRHDHLIGGEAEPVFFERKED
jgi:hypothetical protein